MKKTVAFLLLSISTAAIADVEIQITSFIRMDRANPRDTAAEVCGKVKNAPATALLLKFEADPNSRNPGIYYGHAGPDGLFCQVVSTTTGRIRVVYESASTEFNSVSKKRRRFSRDY